MKRIIYLLVLSILIIFPIRAQTGKLPTIKEKTAGMKEYPGFFTFYWDNNAGKIWMVIDKLDSEFLYVNSLPVGIGSNDIGLDRGQIGGEKIVKFERSGPKILLIQPNYSFRASGNSSEKTAANESFAKSVIRGFNVAAESGNEVLVDATDFFTHDAHNIPGTLSAAKQGSYSLDHTRSALYLKNTKNFPFNTEIEATLTFTGNSPGRYLRETVPTPEAVTVREHYSFVRLPDDNYKPRKYDPRAGYIGISYKDYSSPLGDPLDKRLIIRHNLRKKYPGSAVSVPVKPIVYYVDPGAPEEIKQALIDGASWWEKAYEAAGFKNAFIVKVLPDSVDPMDIRYNVIQWVDRANRGWSYGEAIVDPRTGEIIKGQVTLGALRVRQDYLIAEGLMSPYKKGEKPTDAMKKLALARIRQLAAHETGHTIGLAHNFAASTYGRASVMDYPYMYVKIKNDSTLDFSDAYAKGIGAWDTAAVKYGYEEFPESVNEDSALKKLIENDISNGLIFISDADARPEGSAHPLAHLWDNGNNAVNELNRIMKVRAIALKNFSESSIKEGEPMSEIEEKLAPIYLFHRYQIEAASKVLGGLDYNYALRGDGQVVTKYISPGEQNAALEALLNTITPGALSIPDKILKLIPPKPMGYYRSPEDFKSRTGAAFDPLAAAESAADITVRFILNPERDARLVEHRSFDESQPALSSVIDELISSTWKSSERKGYLKQIKYVVDNVVLQHLFELAGNGGTLKRVNEIAIMKIKELKSWLRNNMKKNDDGHFSYAVTEIDNYLNHPENYKGFQPAEIPAGSPIGDAF